MRLSPKLFLFNVVKCRRINMQIISREERTKVSLSDKCLLNLNASKCQILHHVWCLKESSLLILFHALHHEKIWNLQPDFSMWSSYLLATAPHWYICTLHATFIIKVCNDANQKAASVCKWKSLNTISVHVRLKELNVGYLWPAVIVSELRRGSSKSEKEI